MADIFNQIRAYYHYKREQASLNVKYTSSASSTPYFTFVLWSLLAIKIYQFYWYLIPIPLLIIIYKIIKCFLIYTYIYLTRQSRVQCIIQQIIDFIQVR
jgi:hypothetical protein